MDYNRDACEAILRNIVHFDISFKELKGIFFKFFIKYFLLKAKSKARQTQESLLAH